MNPAITDALLSLYCYCSIVGWPSGQRFIHHQNQSVSLKADPQQTTVQSGTETQRTRFIPYQQTLCIPCVCVAIPCHARASQKNKTASLNILSLAGLLLWVGLQANALFIIRTKASA
jgi:hypothetical protein